jgi:p-aminobenzoyl-glutamate transporter AbgT
MIASVFLLTALGTFVTHRFVEPRLGKWDSARGDAVLAEDGAARRRHAAGTEGADPPPASRSS